MKRFFYSRLCLYLLWCIPFAASAQLVKVNPKLLKESWPARWITHPEVNDQEFAVLHFRKEVDVNEIPDSLRIHVSADSRYKLYVNGQLVSHGPAAGDLRNWQFESLNIAAYLKKGHNVIAAEVWNFGSQRPMAHMSLGTGFILQADSDNEQYGLNTDSSWKVCWNKAYGTVPDWRLNTDIGGTETVDFNHYPSDWNQEVLQGHSQWINAEQGSRGETRWSIQNNAGRFLVPRDIPPMKMEQIRFESVRRSDGLALDSAAFKRSNELSIPANTEVTFLLDQKELVNAYPVLSFDQGKNASIQIAYAEALYDRDGGKGNRNEIEGKIFRGFQDALIASGSPQQYTPLWYRTFRYVQVSIKTKEEPLIIQDFHAVKAGYPFALNARFSSNSPFLDTLLAIGWRTAELCAMETYMDCPYYERLQYIGDTRIQGLISLFSSGDDRLLRQSLRHFDQSRMAEGITLSRYPTNHDQQIPPFSLWWIGMVHDYWMYRDDVNFVKERLPGVRQVLSFFERMQGADGSLQEVPFWNFTDWVDRDEWEFGAPPNARTKNSAILDFQLLWAYQLAAQLESALDSEANAQRYRKKATQLEETVRAKYWSAEKGMFADEDQHRYFSQHANVLAILTATVEGREAQQIMDVVLNDSSLAQTSIYFKYYQFLALKHVGYANKYIDQLSIWRDHMDSGLTTWGEISDANTTRSDCHAWGASPNIEIYRMVLGIDSDIPGFSKVKIEPALGKLERASGSIPHPKGELSVSYNKKGNKWQIQVKLPPGVSGNFVWEDISYPLKAGSTTDLSI